MKTVHDVLDFIFPVCLCICALGLTLMFVGLCAAAIFSVFTGGIICQ